jgi:hypothetical protein
MLVGPTKGMYSPESVQSKRGCPKCGGTTGHEHILTESHLMHGPWGESAEAGDSGIEPKRSMVRCCDCGAKFNHEALRRKGLV